MWWHTLSIPAMEKQGRQISEFGVTLVYIASTWPVKATVRPISKDPNQAKLEKSFTIDVFIIIESRKN